MYNNLLDLGRPLETADIVDRSVYRITSDDSGCVYCYECQGPHKGSIGGLSPLTSSSGVFTDHIHCQMDSAVYVCLEHIPYTNNEFDAFTDDVRRILLAKKHTRNIAEIAV